MLRKLIILSVFVLILISAFPPQAVRADVAPPESPAGTNLIPGNEITQVRMVAETVTLTISRDPAEEQGALAKTEAVFTMRNLGTAEERMQVRFPLSFFNGNSDGQGNFPEIESVAVKINGETVPTKREIQPFFNSEFSYHERDEIPWAVFDVTFPPAEDVMLEVVYSVNGFGYYPYEIIRYILETGAGWNGTIGAADVIVRFPYEVSGQNVWMDDVSGYTDPTSGGVVNGNEVRWHYENLEPTWEDNIQIIFVTPSLWESVLKETDTVAKNPKDGEAWGRLAKAYKEILRQKHGELRTDSSGREMFELSKDAYEKCLALLPKDSLWHYGYADLLWAHYYFELYWAGQTDLEGILPTVLTELQTALALDSNNQQAKDLFFEISSAIPDVVRIEGSDFILLGLTATPIPPTPYGGYPTETPAITPTAETAPTSQPAVTPSPESVPGTSNPVCGTAFILPALLGSVFVLRRRK